MVSAVLPSMDISSNALHQGEEVPSEANNDPLRPNFTKGGITWGPLSLRGGSPGVGSSFTLSISKPRLPGAPPHLQKYTGELSDYAGPPTQSIIGRALHPHTYKQAGEAAGNALAGDGTHGGQHKRAIGPPGGTVQASKRDRVFNETTIF